MLRRRLILAALTALLVVGSTAATLGYAGYLRSARYRAEVEASVGAHLGMHVDIAGVELQSRSSRGFRQVRVALAPRQEPIFECAEATWALETLGDVSRYVLKLRDGWLIVGADEWSPTEYQQLIAGGLGHDFDELGLSEVRFDDFDLRFVHPVLEFRAESAQGIVQFADAGQAHAAFSCPRLNGVDVPRPVNIAGTFTPGRPPVFHEIRLTVPSLPLRALGVERWLATTVAHGAFAGTVVYQQDEDAESFTLTGSVTDADLAELTTTLPTGPYQGAATLNLDTAVFHQRRLYELAGRGALRDLRIAQLVPALAEATTAPGAGELSLTIDQVHWLDDRLQYLSAHGRCTGISLNRLADWLADGEMTGSLTIIIHSLVVADDELRQADIELRADPPADGMGVIDRNTLAWSARQLLGLELQVLLPQQVEYAQLGARLKLDGDTLRVLGTHGPRGQTILTIGLFGREVGLVQQPERTFPVPNLWALVRRQAADTDLADLQAWWLRAQDRNEPPNTPPTSP